MKAVEFFESAFNFELTLNEMYEYVRNKTSNFNKQSLIWFLLDFDTYFYQKRIDLIKSLSDEKIITKVKEYKEDYIHLPDLRNRISPKLYFIDHSGSIIAVSEEINLCEKITNRLFPDLETNCLDFELIILEGEFDGLYTLKHVLNDIMRKEFEDSEKEEMRNLNQPIHWLIGDESLRQFLQSIISANLIESRETDDIIQEHFFVNGQSPTKEPKPIKWLSKSKYLAYLMHRLAEEFIINIKGKKHQLTASHFVSSDDKSLNTKSLASQLSQLMNNSRSTDKNISSIENIIQKVKS